MAAGRDNVSLFTLAYNVKGEFSFINSANKTQAAQASMAKSANQLAIEHAKMAARLQASQARLSVLEDTTNRTDASLMKHKQIIAELSPTYQKAAGQLQTLEQKLASAKTLGDPQLIGAYKGQITQLMDKYGELFLRVEKTNDAIRRESQILQYSSAQIAVKRARIAELDDKLQKIEKTPTTFWGKMKAAIQDTFSSFDKFSKNTSTLISNFNRLTLAAQRATKTANRIAIGLTGKSLFREQPTQMGDGSGIDGVAASASKAQGPLAGYAKALGLANAGNQSLSMTALSVSVAMGTMIANGVMGAIVAFGNLTQQAMQVVASYEKVNLSLQTVMGQQLMQTDATLTMEDAMAQAAPAARELVKWMDKIAIQSIFGGEDVRQMFMMGTGMGLTTDEAKRLTVATLDWATATGKSGYELTGVARVMGQIKGSAKLLGGDLMQLTTYGIGAAQVNQALAKSLGVTVEEVKKLRAEGDITGEQAYEALTKYMEQFSGAAKAQAETLTGLITSLGDIGPTFMRNFFGPIDEATGKVSGVLGALQKRMMTFVTFLQQEWLMEMVTNFGFGFGQMADDALAWGENIIAQLAQGFYNGAMAVVDALSYIGQLITGWLAPGSPPKLLPDLPMWGASAMNEFVKGFGHADFSIFNEITGTIENFLNSAPGQTDDDKAGILRSLIGSRASVQSAIAEMRQFGSVSSDTLNAIYSGLNTTSPELMSYIQLMFQLESQSKALESAQLGVNAAQAEYDAILKSTEEQVNKIENAQSDLLDQQKIFMLELILRDPNATAEEKEIARLEIEKINAKKRQRLLLEEKKNAVDAAQEKLDAEMERIKQLQEQMQLQKMVLQQQQEQNQLLQKYLDLIQRMEDKTKDEKDVKGAGGGDSKPTPAGVKPPVPPDLGGAGSELDSSLTSMLDNVRNKFGEMTTIWSEAWTNINGYMAPVFTSLDGLKTSLIGLGDTFLATKDRILVYAADMFRFVLEQVHINMPQIVDNLSGSLDEIAKFWDKHHDTILKIVNGAWRLIVATISGTLLWISGLIKATLQVINGDWEGAWTTLQETMETFLESAVSVTGQKLSDVRRSWEDLLTGIVNLGIRIFWQVRDAWAHLFEIVVTKATEIKDAALDKIDELVSGLVGKWNKIKSDISTAWTGLKTTAVEKLEEMKGAVVGAAEGVAAALGGPLGAIAGAISGPINDVANTVSQFFDPQKWISAGTNIISGLTTGVTSAAWRLVNSVKEAVEDAIQGVKNLIAELGDLIPKIPGFASGGQMRAGELARVNERGQELFIPSTNGYMASAPMTRRIIDGLQRLSQVGASSVSPVASSQTIINFNYSPAYAAPPMNEPAQNFQMMESMMGAF